MFKKKRKFKRNDEIKEIISHSEGNHWFYLSSAKHEKTQIPHKKWWIPPSPP
jgi:hypothetical protein